MASKREYIERMQMVIRQLHKCEPVHMRSTHVEETFNGKTIWNGDVEEFEIRDHPVAKLVYGWSYGDPEEFITILRLPPVDSARKAVKVGIAHQVNQAKKGK